LGAANTKAREARENYRAALRLNEEIANEETAAEGSPTENTRLTLFRMYILLGAANGRLRDANSRDQYYGKALVIAEELLKAKPEETMRKWAVASAHEHIGDTMLRAKNPAGAAKQFAVSAAQYRGIADADPKNVDAQADLSRILYSQGQAAARNGDSDSATAAAKYFRASLDIRNKRMNLENETDAQRNLMMSLAQVGSHRDAVELAERVRTKLPRDGPALVDIACCYAVCLGALPTAGATKVTHDLYVVAALEALKQAIDVGYGDKVYLDIEPDLDGIRNQAEFKTLLSRVAEP
jgi:hypothetical protein